MNDEDLKNSLAACSLVISRAGANSIAEIAAYEKPAILVPLDIAANDHQRINAYDISRIGGAFVLEESNLGQNMLLEKVEKLLDDNQLAQSMGQKLKTFYHPVITSYSIHYTKLYEIGKIMAGTYEIDPGLKIPEIVKILVAGETRPDYLKVTFPEGLTIKEMAQIVSEKNLDGEGFLNLAEKPSADIVDQFDFLSDKPVQASLEGYLFPDTYFV